MARRMWRFFGACRDREFLDKAGAPAAGSALVTVMGVNGSQVRLGTGAPKNVAAHREEIYDRAQAEKAQQPE